MNKYIMLILLVFFRKSQVFLELQIHSLNQLVKHLLNIFIFIFRYYKSDSSKSDEEEEEELPSDVEGLG